MVALTLKLINTINMETSTINVHPKAAAHIMDMQMKHDLPIELHWKKNPEDGSVDMTFKYELVDYGAYTWLVNKSVNLAAAELTGEVKADD